jgi:DNA gyrase subunit B
MKKEENYSTSKIKVLKGLEAVRLRPGMYIGGINKKAYHHLIWEVVDNSIDEANGGFCDTIEITLHKDEQITVVDNGRGIPVGKHPEEEADTLTVVLSTLHAGAKFGGEEGEENAYGYSGGLHGVGVSVVNALSIDFNAIVKRDGKIYKQSFSKGIPTTNVIELGDMNENDQIGTTINFKPDKTIFKDEDVLFDVEVITTRLKELAYLNKNVSIVFINERDDSKTIYQYKDGLKQYILDHLPNNTELVSEVFNKREKVDNFIVDFAFAYNNGYSTDNAIMSFANNIRTIEDGMHVNGFKDALRKAINDYKNNNFPEKEKKIKISSEHTLEGMNCILNVFLEEPIFEGQTKGKLANKEIKPAVNKVISEYFNRYLEENPKIAKEIVKKAIIASNAEDAAKRSKELARNKDKGSVSTLPGKLASCQSKDPEITELYLVEGDSAAGSAKMGRDRRFQAILPLKGKILNVEKSEYNKVVKSDEISNMITALGTNIGKSFEIDKTNYKKIIIMTDADVDGSHIQTLLITFFMRYMIDVVKNGYLYIAQPPLYKYKKGSFEIYLKDDKELNEFLIQQELKKHPENEQEQILKYLRLALKYTNKINEIKNKYSGSEIIRKLIEFNYLEMKEEQILKIVKQLNFNVLSSSKLENEVIYFIQTDKGLEELRINNDLLNDNLITDSLKIYNDINNTFDGNLSNSFNYNHETIIEDYSKTISDIKKGAYIQRYKGLGEMDPDQLWETTMDPSKRLLIQVQVQDYEKMSETIDLLMGDNVPPRKEFIMNNAINVKNLDV